MKKKVLLIAGQKRSGKDTLAQLIADELNRLGKKTSVKSFAYPMKEIMAVTLGVTQQELEDLKNDSDNPHRGYLQRFGTEGMKPWFGKRVWTDLAMQSVNDSSSEIIIFADFRFPEEGIYFPTYHNTTTLKVHRPGLTSDSADMHISERALENYLFDRDVVNDGDLTDLRASALEIAQWL